MKFCSLLKFTGNGHLDWKLKFTLHYGCDRRNLEKFLEKMADEGEKKKKRERKKEKNTLILFFLLVPIFLLFSFFFFNLSVPFSSLIKCSDTYFSELNGS